MQASRNVGRLLQKWWMQRAGFECCICGDSTACLADGIRCTAEGETKHFTCKECLCLHVVHESAVLTLDQPDITCPGCKADRMVTRFSGFAISRAVDEAAFEAFQRGRCYASEAEMEHRLREQREEMEKRLREETKVMEKRLHEAREEMGRYVDAAAAAWWWWPWRQARGGQQQQMEQQLVQVDQQVAVHRRRISDDVLTHKCPRCKTAFFDFDGCCALQCGVAACRAGFCAWCFADCGVDAHAHVLVCCNRQSPNLFCRHETWQNWHRRERRRKVKQYIKDEMLSRAMEAMVLEACKKELADLGIHMPL